MKEFNIFLISLLLFLVLTPFVLAQWGGLGGFGYGYFSSPLYFLQNEWVMFSIIFMIFFAIIFYTVNRSFKNPGVSGVVALGLSAFISMTIAQKGWLYNYMGGGIGSWVLVVAVLIAFGFLIKFSYESFGRIGAIASVLIIWAVLHGVNDPYDVLPVELANNNTIIFLFSLITSWIGLVFLLIISAIIISARVRRRGLNAGYMSDSLFGR